MMYNMSTEYAHSAGSVQESKTDEPAGNRLDPL
jgi:hypothetical protein